MYVYENRWAYIRLENKGDSFKIQKGLRQEDPLLVVLAL